MKFAIVFLSLLASVASAVDHAYVPHRFRPAPVQYLNRRTNLTDPHTTMTVYATQVHTITSCAPIVTNCPANASGVPSSDQVAVVVTDTVILKTTICPVKSAASVSSSLVEDHSSGRLAGTTVRAPPAATETAQGVTLASTAVSNVVTDKVLTQTIGTGPEASLYTTTIRSTVKTVVTITETASGQQQAAATGQATAQDTTTTVTRTRTNTETITISMVSQPHSGNPVPTGSNPGSNSGSECSPVTVTVTDAGFTVTIPASTVYLTMSEPNAPLPSDSHNSADLGSDHRSAQSSDTTTTIDKTSTKFRTVTATPTPMCNTTMSTISRVHPTGSYVLSSHDR